MDSATPDTGPKPPEADILVCLEEAIARALHEEFQPRTFIDDFSTALQPVVPHDRLGIAYLGDSRGTFSVFATHGAPAFGDVAQLITPVRDERGLDLFYDVGVTPWCHITPDLQTITPTLEVADTSVVLGLRAKIDF